MNKKKTVAILLCILFAILVNMYIFNKVQPDISKATVSFDMSMSSDENIGIQIFYSEGTEFSESQKGDYLYKAELLSADVIVPVRLDSNYIRIDFGDINNRTYIYSASLKMGDVNIDIDLERIASPIITNCIQSIIKEDSCVIIDAQGIDPYIVVYIGDIDVSEIYSDSYRQRYLIYDIILCIIVDLMCALCIISLEKLSRVPLNIYRDKKMVWELSKNDFQSRFAGSYFGVIWAFILPVVTMLLYWFVFQVGLRAGNVSEYPFILFLMSGMIPWFYFSDALNGTANVLMEYSYLVKKVVFEVDILPVIKVISNIFVHLFFIAFIMIICAIYGYKPDVYSLQIVYYILCNCILVLGLGYIISACTVFFRDLTQVVNIILTMGVWITPIMWDAEATLSPSLRILFMANPVYYIVDGFRDSLLAKNWFWDKPVWTIYFWIVTILIYIVGISVFNRLKPHFSDVL